MEQDKLKLKNAIFKIQNVLQENQLTFLQNFVKQLNFTDVPSFVYHREEKKQKIDENVRKSHTLHVKDNELLSFIQEFIIESFRKAYPDLKVNFARNYATFIRYDEGGFFDWHIDFEKFRINNGENSKEMHMLFCVDGPEEGGQLSIKRKGEIVSVDEPKTTNSCVIFDKLLEHRAEEVTKGQKFIMTIDVMVSTIYSTLPKLDEERFIKFLNKETSFFTIGSLDQFEALFESVKETHPERLSEWVPFLQIQVNDDKKYEVDFVPNGMCRYEILENYGCGKFIRLSKESNEGEACLVKDGKIYQPAYIEGPPRYGTPEYKTFDHDEWTRSGKSKQHYYYETLSNFSDQIDGIFNSSPDKVIDSTLDWIANDHDQYDLDGLSIGLDSPSAFQTANTPQEILSLPQELYFGNYKHYYEEESSGYSYHCNEPSYNEYYIRYRYGWCHIMDCMKCPALPFTSISEMEIVMDE